MMATMATIRRRNSQMFSLLRGESDPLAILSLPSPSRSPEPLPLLGLTEGIKEASADKDVVVTGPQTFAVNEQDDRLLKPVSANDMNVVRMPSTNTSGDIHNLKNTPTSIRTVPAEPIALESPSLNGNARRIASNVDQAAMPHATKPPALTNTHSGPPQAWQNSSAVNGIGNGLVRTISSEFGMRRQYSNGNLRVGGDIPPSLSSSFTSPTLVSPETPEWTAAVGKAGSGKTGRVIDRLMGENDMLKRDLKIEKLNTEEARRAARMAEDKVEQMSVEYENVLHEASINKSLLKRKERQVDELKGQIDGEKHKAQVAVESERTWRDAMEKTEYKSRIRVEEAENYAGLMEGRVMAMTSHWKDQGSEVKKTVAKLGKEITTIVEDRRHDDEQILMLSELCAQQREHLLKLTSENEAIIRKYEDYKKFQDDALRGIKENAKAQNERNDMISNEAKDTLGKLRWALAIKQNVPGAQ